MSYVAVILPSLEQEMHLFQGAVLNEKLDALPDLLSRVCFASFDLIQIWNGILPKTVLSDYLWIL